MNDLKALVGEKEKIFFEGRPDLLCYIFEGIFNPMLPIAIIWGLIDFGFIGTFTTLSDGMEEMGKILIPFFALHLMPVWIYLFGILTIVIRYLHTYYIVTDAGIYVSGGVFNRTYDSKPFAELSHVNLHRGIFDQVFGVGDIVCTTAQVGANGAAAIIKIDSIRNYAEVLEKVKTLQRDIYSDTMFPNDLRPGENHGYKTEYKG